MKLQPTLARVGKDFEIVEINGIEMAKGVVVVPKEFFKEGEKDVSFIYVTCFGPVAKYLGKYAVKGARIFIKDWSVNQKINNDTMYYDFILRQVELVDYKEKAEQEDK